MFAQRRRPTWLAIALGTCVWIAGCQRQEHVASSSPDASASIPAAPTEEDNATPLGGDETPAAEENPLPPSTEDSPADTTDVAVVDDSPASPDEIPTQPSTPAPPAFSGKELPADAPQPEDVQRKLKSYEDGYITGVVELLLTYPQASVRTAAAERLGYLSREKEENIRQAILGLRGALRDPSPEVRAEALDTISYYKLAAKDALPEYIRLIDDANEKVREHAYGALQSLGPEAAPAVPTIARRLASKDYEQRGPAIITLGTIGPAAKSTVPLLEQVIAEYGYRDAAALAMARMGVEGRS